MLSCTFKHTEGKVFLNEIFSFALSGWTENVFWFAVNYCSRRQFMSSIHHSDSYSLCYNIHLTLHIAIYCCYTDSTYTKSFKFLVFVCVCLHLCFVNLPQSKDLDHILQRSWITLKPRLSSFYIVHSLSDEACQHDS